MGLLEDIQKIEAELAERREKLDKREATIDGRLEAISLRETELTGKENAIGDRSGQLDEREQAIATREARIGSITDLEDRRVAVVRKELELKSYENDLALIKQRQDEREIRLNKDRMDLEEDKKTYIEKLKSQFIEQLQKVI